MVQINYIIKKVKHLTYIEKRKIFVDSTGKEARVRTIKLDKNIL